MVDSKRFGYFSFFFCFFYRKHNCSVNRKGLKKNGIKYRRKKNTRRKKS